MRCSTRSRRSNYRYEYCTGGKTGYTDIARSTLVTYAEKDGMSLVCVVMHTESPNQWTDSRNLFDYAFDNFQLFNIADNETRYTDSEAVEVGALNNNKGVCGHRRECQYRSSEDDRL